MTIKNWKWLYICIVILLTGLKLFLVSDQPIFAIPYAIHDDRHFIDQAASILKGEWLGPYTQMTLIKGPFYPLWIAFTSLLGVPLLLSEHLLYIFACIILTIAISPILLRKEYSFLLFLALLFNPFSYDRAVFTRVIREGIYPSICILVIACLISLLLKRREPIIKSSPWIVGLGLAVSAASLTREDTIWLLPPILLIFMLYWTGKKHMDIREVLFRLGIWALLPAICLFTRGIISYANYRHYSIFQVTEMNSPEFVAAFSAIQRVAPKKFARYIPVSKETRLRIYALSPAFKELEPFLEGDIGRLWENVTIPGAPKDEIVGGWFMWAFRDAVAAAGYYKNGEFPAEYYRDLANEVNTACDSGVLTCNHKSVSLAPVWNNTYFKPSVNSFLKGSKIVVQYSGFDPYPKDSPTTHDGDGELLFRDLTRNEISQIPSAAHFVIKGWAVREDGKVHVKVTKDNNLWNNVEISILPSPDVYNFFLLQGRDIANAKLARFEISTSCLKNCFLEIRNILEETLMKIPLDSIDAPASWNISGTIIFIDSAEMVNEVPATIQYRYNMLKMKVLNKIGQLYQYISPYSTLIAILAFIALTIRTGRASDIWMIAALLLIAGITRIAMLSVIDATSFPAQKPLYLCPVYPLVIAFTIITLSLASDSLLQRFKK